MELVGFSIYEPGAGYLGSLSRADFEGSAHLITPAGKEYHGGEAITRALRLWRWGWLARPLDLPGLAFARASGYRLIARNRSSMGRLARLMRG